MSLQIDTNAGTCTIEKGGAIYRSALSAARITTDPQARMSELHIEGASLHISESDAEQMIVHGAHDERSNLIVDE